MAALDRFHCTYNGTSLLQHTDIWTHHFECTTIYYSTTLYFRGTNFSHTAQLICFHGLILNVY